MAHGNAVKGEVTLEIKQPVQMHRGMKKYGVYQKQWATQCDWVTGPPNSSRLQMCLAPVYVMVRFLSLIPKRPLNSEARDGV